MYIPAHFREDDLATLQALMREYSFATLVSTTDEGVPIATPLPFLLESEPAALWNAQGSYGAGQSPVAHVPAGPGGAGAFSGATCLYYPFVV